MKPRDPWGDYRSIEEWQRMRQYRLMHAIVAWALVGGLALLLAALVTLLIA